MAQVQVGSVIEFDVRSVPSSVIREIRAHLTFIPKRPPFGSRRGTQPEPVLFYRMDRSRIVIPRGALTAVRRMLEAAGVQIQFEAGSVVSNAGPTRSLDSLGIRLRPYQMEAVDSIIGGVQGVVVMPCGGGKTTTAASAVLRTGEAAVVVAHTRDILDQWIETFERLSGVRPSEVGQGNLSALSPGEVRVAMVQTVDRLGRLADSVLGSAGALVLDECHHTPASTWMDVLARCPARYRWGLTATPERSDGLGVALDHLIGPVRFRIPTRVLIDQGYLLSPTIVPVDSGWQPTSVHYPWFVRCVRCGKNQRLEDLAAFESLGVRCSRCRSSIPSSEQTSPGKLLYSRAVNDLSLDPTRVAIVARLARLGKSFGRTVLILMARKDGCSAVRDALRSLGVSCEVATSDVRKADRRSSLDLIRSGEASVIVATQLADEGLDLPSVDLVINASPGRSSGRAKQRVGRALRKSGLDPLVFEVVDRGEFEGQWRARCAAYSTEYGSRTLVSADPLSFDRARSFLLSARACDKRKGRPALRF